MLELILYGLAAVVLALVLFAVAVRFLPAGEQIAPPVRDEPPWELPADRRLEPGDVDSVRLPVALRGYRFAETDALLDRLAAELRVRDEEIARLRGHVGGPSGDVLRADGAAADPTEEAQRDYLPLNAPPAEFVQPAEPVQPIEPVQPAERAEPDEAYAPPPTDDR